ncbi:DUF1566 domain-containing protein [Paucibacter sp. AS339]|uniref:Lcl C-terminal domain-containing protein n=1 Tax=Paucibacter hankyongi TaxID=3133434 RepID=UPI0030A59F10
MRVFVAYLLLLAFNQTSNIAFAQTQSGYPESTPPSTSTPAASSESIQDFGTAHVKPGQILCNDPQFYAMPKGIGYHYNGFKLTREGTAIDPRTGLEWQRCQLGQIYVNGSCKGGQAFATDFVSAVKFAAADRTGGHSDWRIPEHTEVETLHTVGCVRPEINPAVFAPWFYRDGDGFFWPSFWNITPSEFVERQVQDIVSSRLQSSLSIRLVRGNTAEKFPLFSRYVAASTLALNQREQGARELADAKRRAELARKAEEEAQARQAAAEEKAYQAALNGKNAQAMYLAAGNYGRNGESSKANAIYRAIISRFAESPLAIKANDQLNAWQRQDSAENLARQRDRANQQAGEDAARQSRMQCGVRISHCEDSCVRGSGRSACLSACKSLCTQF